MASIWMSIEAIPNDDFVSDVVVPLIRALGSHGVHANLEPTRNSIFQNQGDLAYALFPGGELGFFFTTGPTLNPISNSIDNDRYMMASVSEIPNDQGITDDDIDQAINEFQAGLLECGLYGMGARITPGGSISRRTSTHQTRPIATNSTQTSGAGTTTANTTKSGCYVATAVYGGYDLPQVRVLRRFRDDFLGTTAPGRQAIRFYYWVSPGLVRRFGKRIWFTTVLRPVLDLFTDCLRRAGFCDLPYNDPRQ